MYNYKEQRSFVFTEEGQVMFLKIRDKAHRLLKEAGAFRLKEVISGCGGGSSWDMLACVDRLVELKEINEVAINHEVAAQHRIFTQ